MPEVAAWLAWLCSPQDGPLTLVLALVLVVWALGWLDPRQKNGL